VKVHVQVATDFSAARGGPPQAVNGEAVYNDHDEEGDRPEIFKKELHLLCTLYSLLIFHGGSFSLHQFELVLSDV
jgi:hypothetical protein